MMYQDIIDDLLSLGDAAIAEHSQRFFKTAEGEYGFGDKFLGLRVPVLRKKVKQYKSIPLNEIEPLLKCDYHEVRLFALLLLVSRFSKADDNEQEETYHLYLRNTRYINNWDLVDSSAYKIVGAYLEHRDRSVLYDLCKSPSLWERRIAVISTFHFIRQNQFSHTLDIAELLLGDQEDLIHKGGLVGCSEKWVTGMWLRKSAF